MATATAPAEKIDLKKRLHYLYDASATDMAIVEVPPMSFLMVDGSGDPLNSREFRGAVEALYGIAYALKAAVRRSAAADYAVMPLEGLWWMSGMRRFDMTRRDLWKWTLMIMQPDLVNADLFIRTVVELEKKKPPPSLRGVRLERFSEGRCVQVMHLGSYSTEGRTLERMCDFIRTRELRMQGKHHEIYLSDPSRTPPDKLKTLLRQPVTQ